MSDPADTPQTDPSEVLRAKLNLDTGRLPWAELQRHFARGAVVRVAQGLDLVEVAYRFIQDDKAAVAAWLAAGQVVRADDDEARAWQARGAEFWAVVVAPWVLVQEITH